MAVFSKPTGSQIFRTLAPSGGGGQIGSWDAAFLDDNDTNSLIPIITTEYDYAVNLLTGKGYDVNALTDEENTNAYGALVNAIAHQMLQIDEKSLTTITSEPQSGIKQAAYNSRTYQYALFAQSYWDFFGITSNYYHNHTAGFHIVSQQRDTLNPQRWP